MPASKWQCPFIIAYADFVLCYSTALETALAFWDLLLPSSPTFSTNGGSFTQQQLDLWKEYLTETTNNRAVSKDTWSLFLDFTRDIDPEFDTHDVDAAWPSVIDGFVAWAREKLGKPQLG